MSVTVRVALPSDYAAIRELMREEDSLHAGARADVFVYPVVRTLSTEHLDGLRTSSDAALWVAEADGGVVGLAIVVARARNPELQLFREPRFVTLQDLVVASEHRRQGIGTALVRRAEAWAVEQGFKCLELSVWEFNRSAIEFYRSLGYDTDHRRMSREL